MADTKLESFKIADTRKPTVVAPVPKTAGASSISEAHSLGFRRIEEILEKEEPGDVKATLERMAAELTDLEKSTSSNKTKAAAKKAIVAVTRTSDLMEYLFQTKATMQANAAK